MLYVKYSLMKRSQKNFPEKGENTNPEKEKN